MRKCHAVTILITPMVEVSCSGSLIGLTHTKGSLQVYIWSLKRALAIWNPRSKAFCRLVYTPAVSSATKEAIVASNAETHDDSIKTRMEHTLSCQYDIWGYIWHLCYKESLTGYNNVMVVFVFVDVLKAYMWDISASLNFHSLLRFRLQEAMIKTSDRASKSKKINISSLVSLLVQNMVTLLTWSIYPRRSNVRF